MAEKTNYKDFLKVANELSDLNAVTDEDKFNLIGSYALKLKENAELDKIIKELEQRNKRLESKIWGSRTYSHL